MCLIAPPQVYGNTFVGLHGYPLVAPSSNGQDGTIISANGMLLSFLVARGIPEGTIVLSCTLRSTTSVGSSPADNRPNAGPVVWRESHGRGSVSGQRLLVLEWRRRGVQLLVFFLAGM